MIGAPVRLRPLVATAAALAAVGSAVAAVPSTANAPAPAAAPLLSSYIVTLGPDAVSATVARTVAQLVGGTVDHVYTSALNGFSIQLPTALAPVLKTIPGVIGIEADQVARADADVIQRPVPTWGLDRIDQRSAGLNGAYVYPRTGAGVTAYVIDTGIRLTHKDFGGRAITGPDFVDGGLASDCNGHGTHVAGTIGGAKYGVAKGVKLIAVRVLDCDGSGSNSDVVAGVDWVTRHHLPGARAVANMSLGSGPSPALDRAVAASIADGVTYTIAAGNDSKPYDPGLLGLFPSGGGVDACGQSPGRVGTALTVAAIDKGDRRASYSEIGKCVDLFAPGSGITSTWKDSDTSTAVLSGTSMAAPHVAGVAALLAQKYPKATPLDISNRIKSTSTPNAVKDAGAASPNRLLFINYAV